MTDSMPTEHHEPMRDATRSPITLALDRTQPLPRRRDSDSEALKMRSTSSPQRPSTHNRRTISMGVPDGRRAASAGNDRPAHGSDLQQAISRAKAKLAEANRKTETTDIQMAQLQRYLVDTRMRLMPHQNSRIDRYLKKAELFAKAAEGLTRVVARSDKHGEEALRWICRSLKVVLTTKLDVAILERVFTAMDEATDVIRFLSQEHDGAKTVRARALSTLLDLCAEIAVHVRSDACCKVIFFEFEHRFRRYISILYDCKSALLGEIWHGYTQIGIGKLRRWLSGYDRTILVDYSRSTGGRIARYEVTCEWMKPILRDFVNGSEDMLLLTGPAGCGKSFAMGSIVDYARITIRHKAFKLLAFAADPTAPLRRTAVHLVKNLLLQLLDQSAGDAELVAALEAAYRRIEEKHEPESMLWDVLSASLQRRNDETLIVIDGVDRMQAGRDVVVKLQAVVAHRRNLRCIILSRPFDEPFTGVLKPICIPDLYASDIKRYVQAHILKTFRTFTVEQRRELLARVLERKPRAYVEVQLLFLVIARESSYEKVYALLRETPRSLSGLVSLICQNLDRQGSKMILSILGVVMRPIQLQELRSLEGVSPGVQLDPFADRKRIQQLTGGLVEVSGSQVHFLNSEVRRLCIENQLIEVATAHHTLALACLRMIKASFTDPHPLLLNESLSDATTNAFQAKVERDSLLEYSIRFYLVHHMRSNQDFGLILSSDLKNALSDSVLLVLIERRWWERQFGAEECIRMMKHALTLRRAAFGAQAVCVLQTMEQLAYLHQKLDRFSLAMKYYFDAWSISIKISESLAVSFADAFLGLSSHIHDLETNFAEELESIYLFLYRARTDRKEDDWLRYGDILAEFYLKLQRVEQACTIRRETYDIFIRTYGALHEKTRHYGNHLINMLELLEGWEEIQLIRGRACDAAQDELPAWDVIRITITIDFIDSCEAQYRYQEVEKQYRDLWEALLDASLHRVDDAVDSGLTDITLRLCTFLKTQGNWAESRRLLTILWHDIYSGPIRRQNCPCDSVLVNLRQIAELLIALEEQSIATELFSQLRNWYTRTGRKTSRELVLISLALSRYSQECDVGDILGSLFDILIETKIDSTLIEIAVQLIESYETTSCWTEAVDVCRRMILRLWPSFEREESNGPIDLPEEFVDESVRLALRLCHIYSAHGSEDEAERIRIMIFRSCRSVWSIDEARLINITEELCSHFESCGKLEEALETWREMREKALEQLGRHSRLFIRISYHIVHILKQQEGGDLEDVLLEIIYSYGRGHDACVHGSIDAVIDLIRIYERQDRRLVLRRWYDNLLLAFCNKGHDCGLTGDTIFEYYLNYIKLLRSEQDINMAIKISRQFREKCMVLYGVRSIIAIRSLFELAAASELDEASHEKSILAYEELCTYRGSEVIWELVRRARARLMVLYCSANGNPQKAEQMFILLWKEAVSSSWCSSDESLARLFNLIEFYVGRQSFDVAITTIESSIIEIMHHERDSAILFAASKQLYRMYKITGHRSKALEFLASVRMDFNTGKLGVERQTFVLVVALEEMLNENYSDTLYADVLQDVMKETVLYEKWMRASISASLEVRLIAGAQLLRFLCVKQRTNETVRITNEIWRVFAADTGAAESGPLYEFFRVCIEEMKHKTAFQFVETAVRTAVRYSSDGEFSNCYEIARFIHGFVQSHGAWSAGRTELGFKLATTLCEWRSTNLEQNLTNRLQELSRKILAEVLKNNADHNFLGLSFYQLHIICILLGQLEQWSSLQTILETLWATRTQNTWSYQKTIEIGLRLCEVRYRTSAVSEALNLLEDIRYNTSDALGPLHPLTIKCARLRTRLGTSASKCGLAIEEHRSLLQQICVYEHDHDNETDDVDLASLALEQARGLKMTVERFGGDCWYDESEREQLRDLLWSIKRKFSSYEHWHEIDPDSLDTWASQGDSLPRQEEFGCWEEPDEWGFLTNDSDGEQIFTGEMYDEHLIGELATGGIVSGFDRELSQSANGVHIFGGAALQDDENGPMVESGAFADLVQPQKASEEASNHMDDSFYVPEDRISHLEETMPSDNSLMPLEASTAFLEDTMPLTPDLEDVAGTSESDGSPNDVPVRMSKKPQVFTHEISDMNGFEGESMPIFIPY